MRDFNNAYELPNPPSWREKTLGYMRKGFDWLSMLLTKGKQHLPQVSCDNWTAMRVLIFFSNRLLNFRNLRHLRIAIRGLWCMDFMQ